MLSLQPASVLINTLYPSHFRKNNSTRRRRSCCLEIRPWRWYPGHAVCQALVTKPVQFLHALFGCKQVYRVAVLKQAGRTHSISIPSHTVAARTISSGLQSAHFKVRQFSNSGLIIKVGNIFQNQIWILNIGFPSTIVFLLPSFDESWPDMVCRLELSVAWHSGPVTNPASHPARSAFSMLQHIHQQHPVSKSHYSHPALHTYRMSL